jgi:hypothetical protein
MSSNSTESTGTSEMVSAIKELLRTLTNLSATKHEGPSGFFYVEHLYEAAYQFGRHTHLYPDFRQLLTDEDKNVLKEHFPNAFVTLVDYTSGLVGNIGPSTLNVARTRRSQLWFFKNEVLNLYTEVNGNELPKEVKDVLNKLNESNNVLRHKISNWTRPDYDEADDDPEDVPNLNGVPESHNWWTKEHREMWKNKKE